ncbi:MAG TPA: radical SAM protein [Kofleriaceae bacterium]|nr:radical SAM protein [Kofleriaceae bacterium]
MQVGGGYLLPEALAILRLRAGGLELTDVWRGHVYRADGSFGEAIARFVEDGESSPVLAALGPEHPLTRLLERMARSPRMALAADAAVRLQGFDTLFIELVGRCNERCVHCYASSSPDISDALERETVEAVIDDAAALGVRRIQFTGGDPLLCAFLPELVARAAERGLERIEIYTNGLALTDRLLDRLAPYGPSFAFSFYSHEPEHHDAITQTPGSQRRTLAAIERVLARGLRTRVSMVIMEQNAGDQAATVALLRGLGVESIAVTASYEVGRGDRFEGPVEAIGRAHRDSGTEASPTQRGSLCVTYRGEVVPCIFNRGDVLGRLSDRRLRDIALDPALPARRLGTGEELIRACKNQLSCGACQLTSFALQLVPRTAGAA